MKALKLLIISQLFITTVIGQTLEDFKQYKQKYPGSNLVNINHSEKVVINLEKGIPVVRNTSHDEMMLLNSSGVANATEEEIEFNSFDKIENITAYSLVPNTKGYKKIKVENFITKDAESEGYIFHDDSKVTSFFYPGLKEGAIRVLDYTKLTTENRFPFGFYFSNYIPIAHSTFTIDMDSSIHVMYKLWNDPNQQIQFNEKIVKGRRILTWTCANPPILKSEERAVSFSYYAPQVMAQVSHYYVKGKKIQVLETANDLHNWYKTTITNVLEEKPSAELVQITDSIVKGKTNEFEKVRAIYYWVQNNIKYIAFEDGMGGFVPRLPSEVCEKRFGDCKDMASLIFRMLKIANIESYLTWIGTTDLPYKYSEFPSSICDNHMITTYYHNGQPYFLDATASFLTLGYPSYGILGKEAFLHINENEYRIVQVPIMKVEDTKSIDRSQIKIDGRKVIGHNTSTVKGYYNFYINEAFKNLEGDDLNDQMENMFSKGNNTFNITKSSVKNVSERDSTFQMDYDFEINNYVVSYENEVYINMVLDKAITMGELKKDRIAPFELTNVGDDYYIVELEIPKGYDVTVLPKNAEFHNQYVDYTMAYVKDKDKIKLTVNLKLKFLVLTPDHFAEWNEFVKVMRSSMAEAVVLKKK